jgi:protein involved in polysaccharide export with SLBB domain
MRVRYAFLILAIITCSVAFGQLPQDMSKVKASDITDSQLQEYLQKASTAGLTDAQIEQELKKRGVPLSEMDILRARINQLKQQGAVTQSPGSIAPPVNSGSRSTIITQNSLVGSPNGAIFGAELFSNPSLSFEPDLRMPTPKSYILGPDDKILLDIYGTNLTQQELKVSPEGTVNLKYAGPTYINGLTIEQASKKINTRLSKYYPAINSGQTKAEITLTGIRGIKVILVGAVKKPGTYTLSSLATLFNALFVSGGPADNGSFRNIELVRDNKAILVADLYDFLLKANQTNNANLKDNDVIRIPFVKTKITLNGEVNRPGIFELKPNETLADVIEFAGGFKSTAYKARIIGSRLTDFDKQVLEVAKDSIAFFKPKDGDVFNVGLTIDRFQNRVTIEGTVFKPGIYSLQPGMKLTDLIRKAEGFREDAYLERIIITRTRPDLTKELMSIDMSSKSKDTTLILVKDDDIQVSSIFDLRDRFIVSINGAVRKPGNYNYEDSLSLKSLILQAGGFTENATGTDIEISRRKKDVAVNDPTSPIVEIIRINDNKDLSKASADITLQPFDIISVKLNPYYKDQINVSVNGEVLIPGTYSLTSRVEKISDLVRRAGGTLYTANISGARLRRKNNLYDVDLKVVKKIAESSAKDSSGVTFEDEKKPYNEIAINLPKILSEPGGKEDILLEEGDAVYIPTINNLISVSGEVFKPLEISYEGSKTLKDYLADAGGVTNSANKRGIFVVYPNGKAAKVKRSFFFFRKYPEITAGTKIFVPKEPEKKPADLARTGLIVSAISAFITAIALAYQITK